MAWGRRRAKSAEAPRRPWWRRILRWIGLTVVGVVTLVLLLVGAVLVLLHTDWGRSLGVHVGLSFLNDSIRGEVRVERLEGSVFGELAVVGVEVRDPDGALVASVERVDVDWDPWALLHQRVAVHRVLVTRPSFTLEDAEGRVGIARAFEAVSPAPPVPPSGPSPWLVLVERAVVEGGSFSMTPQGGSLGVQDLGLDVAVRVAGGDVVWEGLDATATVSGLPVGPVEVRSSGRFGAEGLRVDALRVSGLGSRVRARGWLGTLDRPRGDVRLEEVHADLGALSKLLPGLTLRGEAEVTGRVHGGYDGATLDLSMATTAGHVEAHAHAALAHGGTLWELEMAGRGLTPSAAVPGAPPIVVDLDLRARGKGDAMKKGRASLALEVLRLDGVPAPPLPVTVEGTLEAGRARVFARARGRGAERLDVWADAVLGTPLVANAGWDLRGVDLALVEALAGLGPQAGEGVGAGSTATAGLSLAGRIHSLSGAARAVVPDGGAPAVDATVSLVAADLRVGLPSLAEPVEVGRVTLRAAGGWSGQNIPTVAAELTVAGARGFDASLGRLRASLRLDERGDLAHGRGVLTVEDARWARRASVDRLEIPFDLLSPVEPKRLPTGRVAVAARSPRFDEHGAESVRVDQILTHVGRSDRTAGPLRVARLSSGAISVGEVGGTVAARKGGVTGAIRIDADLSVASAQLGPRERVARASVDARVRLKPGVAGVTAEGKLTAQAVRAAGIVAIARASATFDAAVGRGRPVVNATVHADQVVLPLRTLAAVDLRASLAADGTVAVTGNAADGEVTLSVDAAAQLPRRSGAPLVATLRALSLDGPTIGIDTVGPATLRWDPAGEVEVHGLELRGLHDLPGTVSVDGAWGRERFDGKVLVNAVPVGRWVSAVRELTGVDSLSLPDLDGTVSVDLSTSGPASAPTAYAKIDVVDGAFGAITGIQVDLEGWIEPGSVRLAGSSHWKGASRLDLDVRLPARLSAVPFSLSILEDEQLSARVDLEGLDLADLRPWVPPPVSGEPLAGSFRCRVDVAGPRSDLRGTVSVAALDVDLGPLRKAELRGQITLDDAGTHGSIVAARGGKGLLRTQLMLPVNLARVITSPAPGATLADALATDPFDVVVELGDVRLAELPYTESLGAELRRVVVGGRVVLVGTRLEPRLEGELHAQQLAVGMGRADVNVELGTRDGTVEIGLRLSSKGASLLEGRVWVPGVIQAVIDRSDLKMLLNDPGTRATLVATERLGTGLSELLPGVGSMIANALSDPQIQVIASVQGGAAGPTVSALVMAETTGRRLPPEQQGIARSIVVSATMGPTGADLTAEIDQGGERGSLFVVARTNLGTARLLKAREPAAVKAGKTKAGEDDSPTIEGMIASRSFDLAGLSRLLPGVFGPSLGLLTVDVSLSGTLNKPVIEGSLEAVFDELSLAALGVARNDVILRVDVQEGRLVLAPIHWEEAGGTLDVGLEVRVPVLDPTQMPLEGRVTLDEFPLIQRGDLRMTLTAGIELAGTVAAPDIHGAPQPAGGGAPESDVTIVDALVNPQLDGRSVRDIGPPVDVVFAAGWEVEAARNGTAPGVSANPSRAGASIDLTIRIPDRSLHIQSDMVDVFLGGNLHLKSLGGAMTIEGMISVLEGSVQLEGRDFVIAEDSRVIFNGGPTIDPTLQVKAEYDISDLDLTPIGLAADTTSRITVEVGGRASAPTLSLRSNPGMDETNIMSILVLGNPVGGGGPGAADAFQKGAVGAFVGLATGRFTRLVQGALSIDVLKVEGGEQSLADAKLTVGKRLTRDLLLMYHANLGAKEDENANEVRVDYRIIQGLHLETRFGDAGKGALDLLYRWRY